MALVAAKITENELGGTNSKIALGGSNLAMGGSKIAPNNYKQIFGGCDRGQ